MWRLVLAVGLGAALEGLLSLLLRRRRSPALVSEVIFFPSRVTCSEEMLTGVPCACPLPHGESALSHLLVRLLAARRSLDLCLFAFSSPQLGRAVAVLHGRGVRVRLVVDSDYMALRGSQIGQLRKAGTARSGQWLHAPQVCHRGQEDADHGLFELDNPSDPDQQRERAGGGRPGFGEQVPSRIRKDLGKLRSC
ncbi:mitochondrial cardiolipin hydrolase isoform X2 [Erythrolamprus reginae]|uniref:mitochondrial cardiolipin hydrolase isoform X2 n=1 Tax=Erythrolamprus reginae TaxID=121349 RepID=UPI00396CA916